VKAMRDLVTRSFETVARWCAALASDGDVEVIVRPRPATTVDVFHRRLSEVLSHIPGRVSIVQRDSVRDWVLASDVVASSYSTTLIEASIAGKPTFMVEPFELSASLRQSWHALLPTVRTFDEFRSASTDPRAVPADELAAWARASLLARGDPIVRIADRLADIVRGRAVVPPVAPLWSVTLPADRPLSRRLVIGMRQSLAPLFPPRPRPAVDPESRADVLALDEVPERVARWRPILDPYLAALGPAVT
jgi:hypothetical protein